MTEPEQPTPKEPVLNAGTIAGTITGLVTTVGMTLVGTGWLTSGQVTAASRIVQALVFAAATIIAALTPYIAAWRARRKVTPVAAPRSNGGDPLRTAEEWAAGYGQHAAAVDDGLSSMARPDLPPDNVSEQVTRGLNYIQSRYGAEPDDELVTWARGLNDTQEIPSVTSPTVVSIPEQIVPDRRLGRHVRHDPRSLSYLVPETDTPTTAFWQRQVPVFDQGNTGSCTGNAAAGVLGTAPFYATLPAGLVDNEAEAVRLYSAATALDDFPGQYPPNDTGSDGLSVAKACQKAGLISGYQHITSVAAAQTAIKSGPFIVGVNWYSSMDTPNSSGLVKVGGSIRGGHEFECHGYDADADLWWFTNSWSTSWGKNGTFCMSSSSFARLLSEQGDATVFLPITQPAPVPTPTPTPTPPQPSPTIPADWVIWARHVLTLRGQSHLTIKVAQEIVAAADQ